jgi:hypothetical protein
LDLERRGNRGIGVDHVRAHRRVSTPRGGSRDCSGLQSGWRILATPGERGRRIQPSCIASWRGVSSDASRTSKGLVAIIHGWRLADCWP